MDAIVVNAVHPSASAPDIERVEMPPATHPSRGLH